ncbi:MAG TPA: ATP-binding protein [Anaerolineales bacterium]
MAIPLIFSTWVLMTYQAWIADGVRDTAITSYILIVVVSALIASWRVSLVVSMMSIFVIWGMAIGEVVGLRSPISDSPYSMAWELTAIFLLLIAFVYPMVATIRQALTAVQENELKTNEEKYRNFIDSSLEGIWFIGFDKPVSTALPVEEQVQLIYNTGILQDCNESLARMYGFASKDQIIGMRLCDLYAGDFNQSAMRATFEMVKNDYRGVEIETTEKTVDGEIVHFLNTLVGRVEDGKLLGCWGTQLNITAMKETQEALERTETRTRALLEAIPNMIFEFDYKGDILRFVPSSTTNPLIPPEEFLGRNISQIMPSDVAEQTMFAIQRALESGLLQVFEYQLPEYDKQRYYEASVVQSDAETVIAMVRDVTVRTWATIERENLIEELEKKNAELEQFTYTVSHDLKSPLITISGFLGYIREDINSGNRERLERSLQRINAAAKKMQNLLDDLLELSRVGRLTSEPEPVRFKDLVMETIEMLHGPITQNKIQMQVDEDLPVIHVDRQRILEVIQNLVDNAVKFMSDQPNPVVAIGQAGELNDMPILFVKDNGIGIAPEFKDRIFGLFNKLDVQSDGTGVGLALVKRIVEFHGGRIWVESEAGMEAVFFFTLPASPQDQGKTG